MLTTATSVLETHPLFDIESWQTPRWNCAKRRGCYSRPVRFALERGLINSDRTVLDFGCGKGDDVERLKNQEGIKADGFDPYWRRELKVLIPHDIVNLGFVISSIENHDDQIETLKLAYSLATHCLVVAVRFGGGDLKKYGHAFGGTFQQFFRQSTFKQLLREALGDNILCEYPFKGIAFVYVHPDYWER